MAYPSPRRAAAIAALAALASLGTSASASASAVSELSTPAISTADPGSSWLRPNVAAGGQWSGSVVVTNTASVARRVRIYAVDASVLEGGAFAPGASGAQRHAGAWLASSVRVVRMEAGASRRVRVRAMVPKHAAPGLYPGAIVVQHADPPAAPGRVRLVLRAALRVYLEVTRSTQSAAESGPACRIAQTITMSSRARPAGAPLAAGGAHR